MTDEQIKQNAEEYILPLKTLPGADENITFIAALREAFVAGAHSRDEEIKRLENRLALFNDDLDKALYRKEKFRQKNKRAQQHIKYLLAKLKQLRNPWISVEDELPNKRKNDEGKELTESKDVFVRTEFVDDDGRVYISYGTARCFFLSEGGHEWSIPNVTHWMPISELPK